MTTLEKIQSFDLKPFEEESKNDLNFYAGIGKDLVPGGIFERFPILRPAVGEHYWREDNVHKKLLIVGESNYIKALNSEAIRNPQLWYKDADQNQLIPKAIESKFSNWKDGSKGHTGRLFKAIREELDKHDITHGDYLLNEVSYYNYFLRPAHKEKGHYYFGYCYEDADLEVAGTALAHIIYRLAADMVIFVSKFSYRCFTDFLAKEGIAIKDFPCLKEEGLYAVPHPSSRYWYSYGKEEFQQLLEAHWINH